MRKTWVALGLVLYVLSTAVNADGQDTWHTGQAPQAPLLASQSAAEQALALQQRMGHRPGQVETLRQIATLYSSAGAYSLSLEALHQALAVYRAMGHCYAVQPPCRGR